MDLENLPVRVFNYLIRPIRFYQTKIWLLIRLKISSIRHEFILEDLYPQSRPIILLGHGSSQSQFALHLEGYKFSPLYVLYKVSDRKVTAQSTLHAKLAF